MESTRVADSLHPFFEPSGVAVIGASADPNKLGYGLLRNLISHGYRGGVYPVNPRRDVILDLPCYPDIASVPDPVELAVIVLPAAMCPPALEACGQRGVRAAIIISGGFREVGEDGRALEEEVLRIARRFAMRLVGPNCAGTIDSFTGLNTTFMRVMPHPGSIAFISQSGAICGGVLEWTANRGIGFSRVATLGNEADVTESDMIEALAADPNTRVIIAYLEAIGDGRHFIDVASRVTPHKPILVIKAGTTEMGNRAVSSHTGSLAGSQAAYRAAFVQSGVLQVDAVEDLIDSAVALSYEPRLQGNRVAVLTNAGGPASLAADELARLGLSMPAPSAATRQELARHLHPDAQSSNPFDILGDAMPAEFSSAMRLLLADPQFDAVLAILVPQALIDPVAVAEAIGRAADTNDKPVVACLMGDEIVRRPIQILHGYRVATYQFPKHAARALGTLWRYTRWLESRAGLPAADQSPSGLVAEPVLSATTALEERWQSAQEKANRLLARAAAAGRTHLGEWEARSLLAAYDIPQPRAQLAQSADAALHAAVHIGFPVALKVISPHILHKSEAGGVLLGLADETAVRRGFESLLARVQQRRPDAQIDGVLVAQMARPGHELIVGMRRDPQFGPLVMFGLGGIAVELLKDVAFRVAPFDREEALRMIAETRAGKLLRGLRGQPPADLAAVAQVIERVAQMSLDCSQIQEIDLNPLVAYEAGQGVVAVDARLVIAAAPA